MTRLHILALGIAAALATPLGSSAAPGDHITIFAAASLREAFEAAAPAFSKRTGTTVTFNFGGSDTLAAQIAQGAPADVFASANAAQMKNVADAGLTGSAPKTFARNRIVLIVPRSNPANITTIAGLAKPGVKVVLAAATVPVGSYARTTFKKVAGTPGYAADYADAVEKNVVSNELDVKAVATKIALGEADAGVVYATDITAGIAAKVTAFPFPAAAAPDATYSIATVKSSQNPRQAQAFVDFILGDGQTFLKARGFLAP